MLTHERVTHTRGAEGDAPQLAPWEACRKRGTQDNPADAFEDPMHRFSGMEPVGSHRWTMGCPRSVRPPLGPRGLPHFNTKNERRMRRRKTRVRDKSRVKRCRFDCSIVCCFNRPSPFLFKSGLDFLYKKRIQISFQRIKKC